MSGRDSSLTLSSLEIGYHRNQVNKAAPLQHPLDNMSPRDRDSRWDFLCPLDRNNRPDIDHRSDAAGRCRRFLPGRPHSVFHASLADQKCSRLCIPAYRGALQCCLADSSQGSNRGCESLIRLYNNNHLQITKTVKKTPLLLAHGSQSQLFEKGYLTIILYICERSCLV